MKQLRRIEITAFRRRTTIVLRDSAEDAHTQPLRTEEKAAHLVQVDPKPARDLDQPLTGSGHLNRGRQHKHKGPES